MKYAIAAIEETNGSFEYHTKFLMQRPDDADMPTELCIVAADWRGNTEWDESLGYYDCEGTAIRPDSLREIPESDFVVLAKYLSVL